MAVLNYKSPQWLWLDKKRKEVEATGWRRHGAKVGDKVRFHCPFDYDDDELWEEIQGVERPVKMRIEHGCIGEIIQLCSEDSVMVRLECDVTYFDDNDNELSFTDEFELRGDILTEDEIEHLSSWEWCFKTIKTPKKTELKQLNLFTG